jgi:drug/metabolite transporter superfamily protein YnfA
MDQKVTIMQLRYHFNLYNLVHIQESYIRYKWLKITQGWWLDALGLALVLLGVNALDLC